MQMFWLSSRRLMRDVLQEQLGIGFLRPWGNRRYRGQEENLLYPTAYRLRRI